MTSVFLTTIPAARYLQLFNLFVHSCKYKVSLPNHSSFSSKWNYQELLQHLGKKSSSEASSTRKKKSTKKYGQYSKITYLKRVFGVFARHTIEHRARL